MDYSQLSDREIDAMVAERVLGWRRVVVMPDGRTVGWIEGEVRELPHFSTDANAAMSVVEKVRQASGIDVFISSDCNDGGWWEVEFTDYKPKLEPNPIAMNQSLPRAICLAALAATEPH